MTRTAEPVARSGMREGSGRLIEELEAQGVQVPFSAAEPAHGVALRLSAAALLDGDLADVAASRLRGFLRSGVPVSIAPFDLGPEPDALSNWRRFCERVHDCTAEVPERSRLLAFSVYSHQLAIESSAGVLTDVLGGSSLYVFLDSLQMENHRDTRIQRRTESNWRYLWRHRAGPGVPLPCYGGFVRSHCPLLAEEVATAVLPGLALIVPSDTAWLPLNLSLTDFADSAGRLDGDGLHTALATAVAVGDELSSHARWATPGQRRDARENRRLAITVTGIGDFVARARWDPADLDCLERLHAIVNEIRRVLDESSSHLAMRTGGAPALSGPCYVGDWLDGPDADSWRHRFEAARRRTAVRNRNLLVMSPYSVLPRAVPCVPAHTDLLPVIRAADAWCFRDPPSFKGWSKADFRSFHRRARAVIQAQGPGSFVAAGV